jgi:pyrroloquinoline quinone biosynthesis protein D
MNTLRQRTTITRQSRPALPRHVRIQFDPVRQAWAVLSPERVFWPNDVSLDILQRCDGETSVAAMVTDLAAEYGAPEKDIEPDVVTFLQEWTDKLLVRS